MKAAVVVPTVRQEHIARFLEAWKPHFAGHSIFVVEDNPERTFAIHGAEHFSWKDIQRDLGEAAWIVPHHTGSIRSYGIWKAWRTGAEMIVTLDDDCLPRGPGFLEKHWERLSTPCVSRAWVSTIAGLSPRGTPYRCVDRESPTAVNHGLWTNIPDLDAVTQLACERTGIQYSLVDQVVPPGVYSSMSSMNVAFHRDVTPAMYFLPVGRDWAYDRFGDIWAGVLVKRICDHLRRGYRSGEPSIEHLRASNVWKNLEKERAGMEVNETFWRAVDSVSLTGTSFAECYAELARKLPLSGTYWDKLKGAMLLWVALFKAGPA